MNREIVRHPARFSSAGHFDLTRSEDMLNSRVLFAVTSMLMLWFDASAISGTQHKTKPAVSSDAAVRQISSISQRAEQGDPQAEYKLGSLYLTGTSVPLDYAQAV